MLLHGMNFENEFIPYALLSKWKA